MPIGDRRAQTFEEFLAIWGRIVTESERPGTIVLVEGERDRAALRGLGLAGPIALVHGGQPLPRRAHEIAARAERVIVLTDWDTAGGRLAHRVEELLAGERVAVDLDLRRRLARVVRGELAHVEGLHGWARRSADRTGTPLEHLLARRPGAAPTG